MSTIFSPPQTPFKLRRARFSDLPSAARTCSLAFGDNDPLFGRLIHPYRKSYPGDVDKYWYRRFVVDFWDWSHVFLLTTEPAPEDPRKELVTGFAHWSRIAPSRKVNYEAGWALSILDPSKYIIYSFHPPQMSNLAFHFKDVGCEEVSTLTVV